MDKIKELEAELRSILETEGALSDDQVARATTEVLDDNPVASGTVR